MSFSVNTKGMRHRTKSMSQQLTPIFGGGRDVFNDGPAPDLTNVNVGTGLARLHSDIMWDVVTKDFHKRSEAGEIFNNPMLHSVVTRENPLVTAAAVINIKTRSSGDWKTHQKHLLYKTVNTDSIEHIIDVPIDRLANLAITAAYAGVTANEQNAVLWFGEFRETLAMFKSIGEGLLSLYRKTKKQRAEWAKGKLSVAEAQSLTLGLLYGLLPLEQSIAQVTEGLFKLKESGTRETSRGMQVYTDAKVEDNSTTIGAVGEATRFSFRSDVTTVTVRAGVLYDIDVSDIPKFLVVVDPKQVVETAYALARMSFVIDWFLNVGNTLKAWSPSIGTNILSAWISIEEIYESEGYSGYSYDPGTYHGGNVVYTSGFVLNLPYKYKSVVKKRIPIDRSDLAIFPRLDLNLDLDKIFALVLLFARIKQP